MVYSDLKGIDNVVLEAAKQLLSGISSPDVDYPGNLKYTILSYIKLKDIVDPTGERNYFIEHLREYIIDTCESLWAFKEAARLNGTEELYQPSCVMDRAKQIMAGLNSLLDEQPSDIRKDINSIAIKNKKTIKKSVRKVLNEYIALTSPFESADYIYDKIYESSENYMDYIFDINRLSNSNHYISILVDSIGSTFNIKTEGYNELQRRRFIMGLLSLGCFKSVTGLIGKDGLKSKVKQRIGWISNNLKLHKCQIERLLDDIVNTTHPSVGHVTQIKYLSYEISRFIDSGRDWYGVKEAGRISNKSNIAYMIGLRLTTIYNSYSDDKYKSAFSYLVDAGYITVEDIIIAIKKGKIMNNANNDNKKQIYLSIIGILNVSGFGRFVRFKYQNTPAEKSRRTKNELLGYTKDWVINKALVEDTPFKQKFTDIERKQLTELSGDGSISYLINLCNNFNLTREWLKIMDKFMLVIIWLGYGDLLTFNYNLYRLNIYGE